MLFLFLKLDMIVVIIFAVFWMFSLLDLMNFFKVVVLFFEVVIVILWLLWFLRLFNMILIIFLKCGVLYGEVLVIVFLVYIWYWVGSFFKFFWYCVSCVWSLFMDGLWLGLELLFFGRLFKVFLKMKNDIIDYFNWLYLYYLK